LEAFLCIWWANLDADIFEFESTFLSFGILEFRFHGKKVILELLDFFKGIQGDYVVILRILDFKNNANEPCFGREHLFLSLISCDTGIAGWGPND